MPDDIAGLTGDNATYEVEFPAYPVLTKSTEDGRFGLGEAAFLRWWRALSPDDRAEFVTIYGGTELLARFVCAYDYLVTMEARQDEANVILEAYGVAAGMDPHSEMARRGAALAWRHDATQALIDRLRYRTAKQAAVRITNKATALMERMLDEAGAVEGIEDKAKALNAALAFTRQVAQQDTQERVERTKRGFQRAKEEMSRARQVSESVTPEQAELHLEMLRSKLGDEQFTLLVKKALPG